MFLQVKIPSCVLYHYDVAIVPDKCPRRVNREIIEALINAHADYFGHQKPVFDGRKNLYSRRPLPIGRDRVSVHTHTHTHTHTDFHNCPLGTRGCDFVFNEVPRPHFALPQSLFPDSLFFSLYHEDVCETVCQQSMCICDVHLYPPVCVCVCVCVRARARVCVCVVECVEKEGAKFARLFYKHVFPTLTTPQFVSSLEPTNMASVQACLHPPSLTTVLS